MNRLFRSMMMAMVGVAITSVFTACQKDDPTVDLNAVVADHPGSGAKVYINGLYGCWQNGDEVKLRSGSKGDKTYSLSVTSNDANTAKITGVTEGEPYTAGYPAANVSNVDNGTLQMCIPSEQNYESAATPGGTAQRIVSPMAAYSADGALLKFYNVGALLKVEITNEYSETLTFYAVEVESDNAPLAGTANVTVTADAAGISGGVSNGSKTVALTFNGVDVTVTAGATAALYIPVLPIAESAKSKLTVHVKATGDNGKYTFHGVSSSSNEGVWIDKNQMGTIPITLNASGKTSVNSYFWGKGTEDCPFLIENQTDLEQLRNCINNSTNGYNTNSVYYLQTKDIQLSQWATAIGKASNTAFAANYNGGEHTVSGLKNALFGYAGSSSNANYIKNVTVEGTISVSSSHESKGGLVNEISTGTYIEISKCISNVEIKVSYKQNSGYTFGIGGLVGKATGNYKISNCSNTNKIVCSNSSNYRERSNYGGIVGLVAESGTIDNCTNSGTIGSDPDNTSNEAYRSCCNGGIVGRIAKTNTTIKNCTNTGTVRLSGNESNYYSSGGICGKIAYNNNSGSESVVNSSTIENCVNKGTIIGVNGGAGVNSCFGGICGTYYGGSGHIIRNCSNEGEVLFDNNATTTVSVGGIVGTLGKTSSIEITIDGCTNSGSITGSKGTSTTYTGGILGWSNSNDTGGPIDIKNCSNTGAVKEGLYVGGIAGRSERGKNTLNIFNCYSTGEVSTTVTGSCVGGIVGSSASQSTNGLATNCYSAGTITIPDNVNISMGAIAGKLSWADDIKNCYGKIDKAYGTKITSSSGTAGYIQFSDFGTINTSSSGLVDKLNEWVNSNSGYSTWLQTSTNEYPHF